MRVRPRGKWYVAPLLLSLVAAACESSPTSTGDEVVLEPRFQQGVTDGWEVEFADYPPADAEIYDLESGIRTLPAPLDTSRKALYVAGSNRSDDLFMFLKRPVDGLAPNAVYSVRFQIEFASDAGSGCVGIGGAPGESVYLKAGATTAEPRVEMEADGWLRAKFDKGNQASGGGEVHTVGDVANGVEKCGTESEFRLKTVDTAGTAIQARTDATGRLWLVVGTDSGYEGITRLYYTGIRVELEKK